MYVVFVNESFRTLLNTIIHLAGTYRMTTTPLQKIVWQLSPMWVHISLVPLELARNGNSLTHRVFGYF